MRYYFSQDLISMSFRKIIVHEVYNLETNFSQPISILSSGHMSAPFKTLLEGIRSYQ
jgi:hypothetical protein